MDTKALLCRGLEKNEESKIQNGLILENVVFGASRLYVPSALYSLYRRGLFEDNFSFRELKFMFRIVVVMHMIDLAGHAMFKYYTMAVVEKHTSLNQDEMLFKQKKSIDDYLVQKNFFKTKKENKL